MQKLLQIPMDIITRIYFECVEYVNSIWNSLLSQNMDGDAQAEAEPGIRAVSICCGAMQRTRAAKIVPAGMGRSGSFYRTKKCWICFGFLKTCRI